MSDAVITLQAPPEQRELVDYAAKLLGVAPSSFILDAACERAQVVVLDHVFFTLSADHFAAFTAALDAAAAPNAGLARLLAVSRPWDSVAP